MGINDELANVIGESMGGFFLSWVNMKTITNFGGKTDSTLDMGTLYTHLKMLSSQSHLQLAPLGDMMYTDLSVVTSLSTQLGTFPVSEFLALKAAQQQRTLAQLITANTLESMIRVFRTNTAMINELLTFSQSIMKEKIVKSTFFAAIDLESKLRLKDFDTTKASLEKLKQQAMDLLWQNLHSDFASFLALIRSEFDVSPKNEVFFEYVEKNRGITIAYEDGYVWTDCYSGEQQYGRHQSMDQILEMILRADSIALIDPELDGNIGKYGLPIYPTIGKGEAAFRSFWSDSNIPFHLRPNFNTFLAKSTIFQGVLDYQNIENHPLVQNYNSLLNLPVYKYNSHKPESDRWELLDLSDYSYLTLSMESKMDAQEVYQSVLSRSPPSEAINFDAIAIDDLDHPQIFELFLTGQIEFSLFENVRFGATYEENTHNQKAFMKNVHDMLLAEVLSVNWLLLNGKHHGTTNLALWDLFDQLVRIVPNEGPYLTDGKGGYKNANDYFQKMCSMGLMFELTFSSDLADSFMYWMTSADFKDIIAHWRDLYKEGTFDQYAVALCGKTSTTKYELFQNRRDQHAAKQFMDSLELIAYLGRYDPQDVAYNPIENYLSQYLYIGKLNNRFYGTFMDNILNNLLNFLTGSDIIDLRATNDLSTGDINHKYPLDTNYAFLFDYLAQICMMPFQQGHNWNEDSQRAKLDAFMEFKTSEIFHLPQPAYFSVSSYPRVFQHEFHWVTATPRTYLLSDFDQSYFYGAGSRVKRGDLSIPLQLLDETIITEQKTYESSNEEDLFTAFSSDPETRRSLPLGSNDNFFSQLFGAETLAQGHLPAPLVQRRHSYHQTVVPFENYHYTFSDNTRDTTTYFYDSATRDFQGNYLHWEMDGKKKPWYVIRKDLNRRADLAAGFYPIDILAKNSYAPTYERNCLTLGKQNPCFSSKQEGEAFVWFLHRMRSPSNWISVDGDFRPLSFEEILFSLHLHYVQWGLSLNRARALQKIFGCTNGVEHPSFAQWWYNYRHQHSPTLTINGDIVENQAYSHNQYMEALYSSLLSSL